MWGTTVSKIVAYISLCVAQQNKLGEAIILGDNFMELPIRNQCLRMHFTYVYRMEVKSRAHIYGTQHIALEKRRFILINGWFVPCCAFTKDVNGIVLLFNIVNVVH